MKRDQRGVTIVELIVAVAVMSIVMVSVFSFMTNMSKLYTTNNQNLTLQNEAQTIMAQLDTFLTNANAGVFDYDGKTYIASDKSVYVIKLDTTDKRLYLAAYMDSTLPSEYTVINSSLSTTTAINQAYVDNAKTKLTVTDSDFELFGEYVAGFSITPYFDENNNNYVTIDLNLEYPDSDKVYAASQNVFLRNRIVTKAVGSSTTSSSSTSVGGGNTTSDPATTIKQIIASYNGGTKYYGDSVTRDDITVTAVYMDGHTETVTEWTCGNIGEQLGTYAVLYTIKYGGHSTGITVKAVQPSNVSAKYSGIVKYEGEMLTRDVVELTVTYTDGTTVTSTNWTSDDLGTTLTAGDHTVNISYGGWNTSVSFKVYPSITGYTETEITAADITQDTEHNIIIDVTGKKYVTLSVSNVAAWNGITYYEEVSWGWQSIGWVQQGSTAGDLYLFITIPDGVTSLKIGTGGKTYGTIYAYE